MNSRVLVARASFEILPGSGLEAARFPLFIRQNVNRAPNWNWRGVLTVFVICPKLAELGGVDAFTNVIVGRFGYPNCALLGRL
jgi:hypothetical protein